MFQFAVTWYYIENLKTPSKVLEIINEFGKVQGKNQYTKLAMSLYTNSRLYKKMNTIPLTIASTRLKYSGIYLINEVKEVYTENYKTVMKKVEEK